MSLPKPIGDKNILNRRVPKNPRYQNIEPVVDTGFNMRKLEEAVGPHLNTRFRKDEKFKRIKVSTLGRLLQQETDKEADVLLLDLRTFEEYEQCHIEKSRPYPASVFRRGTNNYSPEIMTFMNRDKHIIVLYDEEEKNSVEIGEHFYERDVNNVYVLSGGLLDFAGMYAELLSAPLPKELEDKQKAKMMKSPSSRASVRSSRRSVAGGAAGSTAASRVSRGGFTESVAGSVYRPAGSSMSTLGRK